MSLHLIKLAVGSDSIETLAGWQASRRRKFGRLFHQTRMTPRRADELLDGGSIYWVVKGLIQVRQRLLGIERCTDSEGRPSTLLILDPELVRTVVTPQRIFQGWRYLPGDAAPADLDASRSELDDMPPEMAAELRSLGLL